MTSKTISLLGVIGGLSFVQPAAGQVVRATGFDAQVPLPAKVMALANLGAGEYVVSAKLLVAVSASYDSQESCALAVSGEPLDFWAGGISSTTRPVVVMLQATVSVQQGAGISVDCTWEGEPMAMPYAVYGRLLATNPWPTDVRANLTMLNSTETEGNILKGDVPSLHNFGSANTFLGANAGNLMMSGIGNTASGTSALFSNTTGGGNTASGFTALFSNTTGSENTASGLSALFSNTTGASNTASGVSALASNTSGNNNTALGFEADVSQDGLVNATAIGNGAIVNASNKVRVGNTAVTVIEGQVGFTASSDVHQKENFQPVDGEEVLGKLRGLRLTSWNFIGHDPKQFRHYGPMAQDFFAAFGHDGIGTVGTETTITSTDMDGILMIAAQALERRTVKQQNRIARHDGRIDALTRQTNNLRDETNNLRREADGLRAENSELKARLEALEQTVAAARANETGPAASAVFARAE